ncbi:hypothetical protein ACX9NF_11895 [Mycobacterium sp. ML1]
MYSAATAAIAAELPNPALGNRLAGVLLGRADGMGDRRRVGAVEAAQPGVAGATGQGIRNLMPAARSSSAANPRITIGSS